jgi:hypothetical protein
MPPAISLPSVTAPWPLCMRAVLDHDVLRRAVLGVEVLAGLDRDAVVAGVELAASTSTPSQASGSKPSLFGPRLLACTLRIVRLRQATGWCCQNGVLVVW